MNPTPEVARGDRFTRDPAILSATDLVDAMRREHRRTLTPVDLRGLDRVLRHDVCNDRVEVQASTTWQTLSKWQGQGSGGLSALADDPDLPATIGASVARNSPLPDGTPIVCCVETITMVTPDGELRRVNRSSAPGLFSHVLGGQNIFGTAYSITLRLGRLEQHARGADMKPAAWARPGCETVRLLLPPEEVDRASGAALRILAGWNLEITSVRTRLISPESETILRWAASMRAMLAISFIRPDRFGSCVRTEQARRDLVAIALAFGGTFPIAECLSASRDQTIACYPMLRSFLAEKRRFDPAERLINDWYLHYRNLVVHAPLPEDPFARRDRATSYAAARTSSVTASP